MVTSKLELSPFNPDLQTHMVKIQHELRLVDLYEAKGAQLKDLMHWLKVGDRISKDFFK